MTEDELHAYVDGELPADRRAAVEAWLATHPDDAARVAAWRAQADAIRARYGAVADEPVPAAELERSCAAGRPWRAVAAAPRCSAFVVGGGAGWLAAAHRLRRRARSKTVTAEALEAHRLYIAEVRHPIEVPAEEAIYAVAVAPRRHELRAPDLGAFGLKLLGGRLLPGIAGRPRCSCMRARRASASRSIARVAPRERRCATTPAQFGAILLDRRRYGYVVSGPKDKAAEAVVKAAYDQIDKRTPRSPAHRA